MIRSEVIEIIIFCSLLVVLAIAWYVGYVIPRTEFLYSVMDCMSEVGDHTEVGYNFCVDRISG